MVSRQAVLDHLDGMCKNFPRSRRAFLAFVQGDIYGSTAWSKYTRALADMRILSVAASASGSTIEVRVKTDKRIVLRVPRYCSDKPERVAHYVADEMWKKFIGETMTKEIASRVFDDIQRVPDKNAAPEYGGSGYIPLFAFSHAAEDNRMWLQFEKVIESAMSLGGKAAENARRHMRELAIRHMAPVVKQFLANGGTYEEMVALLQQETVASVQDE
jgi:hypothetical protein